METKACPRCKTVKPITDYGYERKGKRKCQCRVCDNARMRQWRAENSEARRKRDREDYHKSKARNRLVFVMRTYGMTVAQATAAMATAICEACGGKITRIAIDHCHTTGKTRGILCQGCNLALGHLKDDPLRIDALAAYLRSHQ